MNTTPDDHHIQRRDLIQGRDPLSYLDQPDQQPPPASGHRTSPGTTSHAHPTTGHGRLAEAVDIDRLLTIWCEPLPADDDTAAALFRTLYADPVAINGNPTTATQLVARARTIQAAIGQPHRQILHHVHHGNQTAIAFTLEGTHTGPLPTSAGVAEPTGKHICLRIIDILTTVNGKITDVMMVADELGALTTVGLTVSPPRVA